ncbi:MAG: hypothetical protein ACKO50_05995 [Cyanobium sp.]
MPQCTGLDGGEWSSSDEVRHLVENADLILDIGGVMETERHTGMWIPITRG